MLPMALNNRSQFPLHKQRHPLSFPSFIALRSRLYWNWKNKSNLKHFTFSLVNRDSFLPVSWSSMKAGSFWSTSVSTLNSFLKNINSALPHTGDTVSSTREWYGTKDAPRISFCRNKCPPQSSVKSERGCPLPRRRDFYYINLLAQRAARQPGTLRSCSLHFWLVPVCALPADPVPHTISWEGQREQQQWPPFNRWSGDRLLEPVKVAQWLCSVPPWASLGTLRSAIAMSHCDVVASAERAV